MTLRGGRVPSLLLHTVQGFPAAAARGGRDARLAHSKLNCTHSSAPSRTSVLHHTTDRPLVYHHRSAPLPYKQYHNSSTEWCNNGVQQHSSNAPSINDQCRSSSTHLGSSITYSNSIQCHSNSTKCHSNSTRCHSNSAHCHSNNTGCQSLTATTNSPTQSLVANKLHRERPLSRTNTGPRSPATRHACNSGAEGQWRKSLLLAGYSIGLVVNHNTSTCMTRLQPLHSMCSFNCKYNYFTPRRTLCRSSNEDSTQEYLTKKSSCDHPGEAKDSDTSLTETKVTRQSSGTHSSTSPALDGSASSKAISSVGDAVSHYSSVLEAAEVPEAELSAEYIVAHILGTARTSLPAQQQQQLTEEQLHRLDTLVSCRLQRMPVQYIVGDWDFHNICLDIWPPVFIPRPETEVLVSMVLELLQQGSGTAGGEERIPAHQTGGSDVALAAERDVVPGQQRASVGGSDAVEDEGDLPCTAPARVLELCCGSGAISLAILNADKKVECTAVDQSGSAITLAAHNAHKLGLQRRLTLLHAKVARDVTLNLPHTTYDVIVANPPYVFSRDIRRLQPEILLYEDLRALDGGADGLDVIKSILLLGAPLLRPGGRVLLEVDPRHSALLPAWLEGQQGRGTALLVEDTVKDYSGKDVHEAGQN